MATEIEHPVDAALPSAHRRVTIVTPTYKEVENLPHLIERLSAVRDEIGDEVELLVMDDDSRDGSQELVASRPETWVELVVRKGDRSLSAAVLEGFKRARGDVLVCMDADLSHPPEAIPELIRKLDSGADFVLGSRYVPGGTTSDDWGFLRWLNSRVATLLARPFTAARDPMAGFFALRRSTLERGRDFSPIGYKIALELIVKCHCERVVEVPIHFEDRIHGESKLTLRQQLLYIQHLRRLYVFRFGVWSQLAQFAAVGALGTVVNLCILTLLVHLGVDVAIALALAIFLSMCLNFGLNRRFSFSVAPRTPIVKQFFGFIGSSAIGAVINYNTALFLLKRWPQLPAQVAALVGIAVGMGFNFVASRYLVFRAKHIRARATKNP